MALVNTTRKFIYLFEPHTASRATELALAQVYGSKVTGNRHAGIRELISDGYITQIQAAEYRIVCTVRNPLDTYITRWMIKSNRHTDNMVDDIQAKHIKLTGLGLWAEATDHVWFEHLDEDIQSLFRVKMPKADPKHKNKYKNKPWQDYYNIESFSLVVAACKPYMDKFGYRPFIIDKKVEVTVDKNIRGQLQRNQSNGIF